MKAYFLNWTRASKWFLYRYHVWGVFLPQLRTLPGLCSRGSGGTRWPRKLVQVEIRQVGGCSALSGAQRVLRTRASRVLESEGVVWLLLWSSKPFVPAPLYRCTGMEVLLSLMWGQLHWPPRVSAGGGRTRCVAWGIREWGPDLLKQM